jgi:hypothetical protein
MKTDEDRDKDRDKDSSALDYPVSSSSLAELTTSSSLVPSRTAI